MLNVPIDEIHRRFGKKFIALADYEVPAFYSSFDDEFYAALKGPVLIDRSFVGFVQVSGKDAGSLLQRLTTNEMGNLQLGQGLVNIFTNEKGRIVEVVQILRRQDDYFILTSPGRAPALLQWIDKYTFIEDVRVIDVSSAHAMFSVFGEVSRTFAGLPIDHLQPQDFCEGRVAGAEVVLHRTEGIAPHGYNILVKVDSARSVWNFLREHAEPIGFWAYDALRIHAGIPAADAEITEHRNPYEVNLRSFINYEKGCYIGQEVIARLDAYDKVQRRMVGLEFGGDGVPAMNSGLWLEDNEVGLITSSVFSPVRNKAIGLGLLRKEIADNPRPLVARNASKAWTCTVVAVPFS